MKYFLKRCDFAWPFRGETTSGHAVPTSAAYIVNELGLQQMYFGRYCKCDEYHGRGLLSWFLLIRPEVFEGLNFEMVVETCCLFDPEDKVMSVRDAGIHLQGLHGVSTEVHSRMHFPFPAGYMLRAVDQKHLESFEMWCWRRMEKISWTDHVRNEDLLLRVKEQRNILHEIRKRKANWIGHILRRNCLLQRVTEGKIQGG